jgi:hypothetical protein
MDQGSNDDLMGIGSQFHPNEQLITPNTQHITYVYNSLRYDTILTRQTRRRSPNVVNILANMTHHPSAAKHTSSATKEKPITVSKQDFQNGGTYSAMERWYNEHHSQQPWNGLSTGATGNR